ncbi:MAG: very short patch repair endonuclease [Synergistales bacterium]
MDMVDEKTRSRIMASVRQKNTGPEMLVRKTLHRMGLRYRLHDKKLPGSPDLVFPRFSAVIFVHGCFWHRHEGCRYATTPSSSKEFWKAKFEANKARDRKNYALLEKMGWRVLVVWECTIKKATLEKLGGLGKDINGWLRSESDHTEIG